MKRLGPNDRVDLAAADKVMRQRINKQWMLSGVTIVNPDATYIEPEVTIGQDTIIQPNTFLCGKTEIGEDCVIGRIPLLWPRRSVMVLVFPVRCWNMPWWKMMSHGAVLSPA